MPTRIIIADDHIGLRDALSYRINEVPDIQVVGQAGDGLETVEMARALTPDVAVVDVTMPGISGIEACRQIQFNSDPHTPPHVVVLHIV
jgi:DNA-binding NarL/FixJ family response regulator